MVLKTAKSLTQSQVGLVLLLALALMLPACGGGAGGTKVDDPIVRAFSPFLSPIDFDTLQQNPTYTDGDLTVSTDPNYPGKIAIFFEPGTEIASSSIFVGGDPGLGVDLAALAITRFIPGTGPIELALSEVEVHADRIICTPATMPLADGQYSVAVEKGIQNTQGKSLLNGPVLHSFTVGAADTVAPFVIVTSPINNAEGVGAGAPAVQPTGQAETSADIQTAIFGPTSPDVTIRFNEPLDSTRVLSNINNISVANTGFPGVVPPPIAPAAGFPMLKSHDDSSTLPSNAHEILWRADEASGGFPFGTIIEVTLVGAYNDLASAEADSDGTNPDNDAPIADLSGNPMRITYKFSFQTVAPPDLPENPYPEYSIWWAASDRVGALDIVNQLAQAQFLNGKPFPDGIPENGIPPYTDTVANAKYIPGFAPTELNYDSRSNYNTQACATWLYAISPNTSQIVIVDSRWSLPVALINTPQPGGISVATGGTSSPNVLTVTNSSANTLTVFDVRQVTPGFTFVNGPIFVQSVQQTGNTPRAITIDQSAPLPIIMYVDFTDGVVNTTRLNLTEPVKQFILGGGSAPNDVVTSGCVGNPPFIIAAISQGGLPGEGKVAYYISGPSCTTGTGSGVYADNIIGDLTGFDGPAGLDRVLGVSGGAWFAMAESGADANRVRTLGLETGAFNTPSIVNTFNNVGANPVAVAHRSPYFGPAQWGASPSARCGFEGLASSVDFDLSQGVSQNLYICARGAGQITVMNMVSGFRSFYSPIKIPGIRFVVSQASQ